MDVGEFSKSKLYIGLRLDYSLKLWALTSASRAISAVAEFFVTMYCGRLRRIPRSFACRRLQVSSSNLWRFRAAFLPTLPKFISVKCN